MRTNIEMAKADRGTPEPPWLRPLSEYGPVAVFFMAYVLADLLWATAVLMAATVVALSLSLAMSRRVPLMPVNSSRPTRRFRQPGHAGWFGHRGRAGPWPRHAPYHRRVRRFEHRRCRASQTRNGSGVSRAGTCNAP